MTKRLTQFILAGLLVFGPAAADAATFRVSGTDAKPWAKILGAVGIGNTAGAEAAIVVAGSDAPAEVAKLADNRLLILEGMSAAVRSLGIAEKAKAETVPVRQMVDTHASG